MKNGGFSILAKNIHQTTIWAANDILISKQREGTFDQAKILQIRPKSIWSRQNASDQAKSSVHTSVVINGSLQKPLSIQSFYKTVLISWHDYNNTIGECLEWADVDIPRIPVWFWNILMTLESKKAMNPVAVQAKHGVYTMQGYILDMFYFEALKAPSLQLLPGNILLLY